MIVALLVAHLAAVVLAHPAGAAGRAPDSGPTEVLVDPGVRDAVAAHGEARVIVQLADAAPAWLPFGLGASSANAASRLLDELPAASHRGDRRYRSLPVAATTVDAEGLAHLISSPRVERVMLDELSRADLAQSAARVEAPTVWATGNNGSGRAVVIVDTGVDSTHPFLGGRVVAGACFSTTYAPVQATATCPGADPTRGFTIASGGPCPVAQCNHGTHVAGIAAGGTGTSGSGMAYGASIISLQVFSRVNDAATCGSAGAPCALTFNSDMLAALDYVDATLRFSFAIDAVNMSIGSSNLFAGNCDTDGRKPIIDSLRLHGIAVVAAAGNSGDKTKMSAPACISSTISVGATLDTVDTIAGYSNGNNLTTVLAPGSNIVSSVPGGGFSSFNGTSMATPHVTGAIALMRKAVPGVAVSQQILALQMGGVPTTVTGALTKPRLRIAHSINVLRGIPQIDLVTPKTGTRLGGTTVVLKGLSLSGVTAVSFGGVPATSFTVNSYFQITAVAPAHAIGWVNVSATKPAGTSPNVLASWYQYT